MRFKFIGNHLVIQNDFRAPHASLRFIILIFAVSFIGGRTLLSTCQLRVAGLSDGARVGLKWILHSLLFSLLLYHGH